MVGVVIPIGGATGLSSLAGGIFTTFPSSFVLNSSVITVGFSGLGTYTIELVVTFPYALR